MLAEVLLNVEHNLITGINVAVSFKNVVNNWDATFLTPQTEIESNRTRVARM